MRTAAVLGFLSLMSSLALAAPSAPAAEAPSPVERAIVEKHLRPLPTRVQVAVALVEGDSIRFIGAERTREGIRYLDNRDAVFEIGSTTKVFTATLLAQQVRAGVVRLDTPVRRLVPFELNAVSRGGVAITLGHLANHTSGLCHQPPGLDLHALFHGHAREPFRDYDDRRFKDFLRSEMELAFTPGTRYSYSNMGMSLVGHVLEWRTGKRYESLLREGIFEPLGMGSSTTDFAKVRDRVVHGIEKEGVTAPNWDMAALAPAGGLKTSAADFARFVRAQLTPDSAMAMTQRPTFPIEKGYSVGLGWHIVDRANGESWLNHGGGMAGYTTIVNVNLQRQCAVVVLSNLGNAHRLAENVSQLGRDLLKGIEARP